MGKVICMTRLEVVWLHDLSTDRDVSCGRGIVHEILDP